MLAASACTCCSYTDADADARIRDDGGEIKIEIKQDPHIKPNDDSDSDEHTRNRASPGAVPHAVAYRADAERLLIAAFVVGVKVGGMHLELDVYNNMTYGDVELHLAPSKLSLHNTPKQGLRAWACAKCLSSSLTFSGARAVHLPWHGTCGRMRGTTAGYRQ